MRPPTLIRKTQQPSSLSTSDRKKLTELEAKVENSMMDFCVSLAEIRDYKDGLFWKGEYTSFYEYARSRFGYGQQHAGRLVATGSFLLQLASAKSNAPRPIRENQVRPLLNKLPVDHQIPCWEIITEKTPPSKLTGDVIEAEVIQYRKKIPKPDLKAGKPARKPKKTKLPKDLKARVQSHAWIEKLKTSTANLPKAPAIVKLLKEVATLVDQKR